jgi:hypothetical protein
LLGLAKEVILDPLQTSSCLLKSELAFGLQSKPPQSDPVSKSSLWSEMIGCQRSALVLRAPCNFGNVLDQLAAASRLAKRLEKRGKYCKGMLGDFSKGRRQASQVSSGKALETLCQGNEVQAITNPDCRVQTRIEPTDFCFEI